MMALAIPVLASTGCKNVCEKAVDHMIGCIEDFCDEQDEESEGCAALEANRDAIVEQAMSRMGECEGEAEVGAETMKNMDCDALMNMFGGQVVNSFGGGGGD